MPNRILRDGILTSESVSSLNWAEEVFYRRLMSVVDDHGRFHAAPKLIRAACYPLLIDKVSDADIGKWLSKCLEAALVSVYPAQDGKRYIQIIKFGQQVRAKSKFPEPTASTSDALLAIDSSREQKPATAHLGGVVFGVVVEDEGVSRGERAKPTRKTGLPEDFAVSSRVQGWAKEHGFDHLPEHLDAFKRKASAHGYTYANWDAAFMEAIREDWAKLRGRTQNGAAPPAAGVGLTVESSAVEKTANDLAALDAHAALAQTPEAHAARRAAMARVRPQQEAA